MSAFATNPALLAIVLAFRNKRYIADAVLPRSSPLQKKEFKWFKLSNDLVLPDTRVGRRSQVNEVDISGQAQQSAVEDYGLEYALPNEDESESPESVTLSSASEMLTDWIAKGREDRVAKLVFNKNTYGTNTETVAAGKRFDVRTFDVLGYIVEGLETPVIRPNTLVIGQSVWSKLRQHPTILKAVNRNSGDTGLASQAEVAELLEIENFYVGQSVLNLTKPSAKSKLDVRGIWGNGMAAFYQDKLQSTPNQPAFTFGFTAQYKDKVAQTKEDDKIGLRGGTRIKVGESVKELILAPETGFYWHEPLAN